MSTSRDPASVKADDPLPPGRKRRPGAGRRRDPAIDTQIVEAARSVYRAEGWAGFTVDAVAKAAGVSRDAVNRRHRDLQSLLLEAIVSTAIPRLYAGRDLSDPRAALHAHALELYDYFSEGDGPLTFRLHVEAAQFPDVYRAYRDQVVDPYNALYERALAEILERLGVRVVPEIVSVVAESIAGSVMLHALLNQATVDDHSRTALARTAIAGQVDHALTAVGVELDTRHDRRSRSIVTAAG